MVPLNPKVHGYIELVQMRKKSTPYKPYIHGKHIESILGTCKNTTKICIQFE
jgi:hypothetical protein